MKVCRFEDANQFYQRAKDYLLTQEILNNLLLGICDQLIHHPEIYDSQPYLAIVETNGEVIAVAMRTPPRNLILSNVKDSAVLEAITQDLHFHQEALPGILAPIIEAQTFAEQWQSLTGKSYQLKMAQRIFQIEQVQLSEQVDGYLRVGTENDRDLLKSWYDAFSLEALGKIEPDGERWVERQLEKGTAFFWEDKATVSIACHIRSTPNGAGISMVYTPPEYRKKGYASACVAALSQNLLDKGYKYCFLFTDLANPTSNHIYQKIGYQPVGDYNCYSFMRSSPIKTE